MDEDFRPPYNRRVFWLGAVATLLCYSMTTSQALLPVVLSADGMSRASVGFAMSATMISVLIFGIVSGLIITRYGSLAGVVLGTVIMLCAHSSIEFLPRVTWAILSARFVHGVGAGIALPATLAFATLMVQGKNETVLFGMFTSAIPGANLIGPPLGEWYFNRFGADGFFLVTALPGLVSLIIFIGLLARLGRQRTDRKVSLHYFALLKRIDLYRSYIGLIVIGSFWGYVISFISVAFTEKHLAVSLFFVPMTLGLFLGRFVGLGLVRSLNHQTTGLMAIGLTASSLLVTSILEGAFLAGLSGIVFGIGYSLAYPTFSMWISSTVTEEMKGQAIALANTIFNFVMFAAPAVCAFGLGFMSIATYQCWLAIVLFSLAVIGYAVLGKQTNGA